MTTTNNTLYFGDNLNILRQYVADESVDLIYLDPPFNSKATYNVLFQEKSGQQSAAQITAFDDTWQWGAESEATYHEVVTDGPKSLGDLLQAMRAFLGQNNMMAYLTMMAPRLVELHRVLKVTGSIYLHCDDTACHYIKLLMDAIFGTTAYRNHIVWRRATSHNDPSRFGRITDHILFYAKGHNPYWDGYAAATHKSAEERQKAYPSKDERGYYRTADLTGPLHGAAKGVPSTLPWHGYDVHAMGRCWSPPKTGTYARYIDEHLLPGYLQIEGVHARLDALDNAGLIHHPQKGKWPGLKRYASADQGTPPQNLILEPIGFTNYNKGKEYLGYPTQKPLGLLEKIIKVSSAEGDVVLDPFCGCGTAIAAAERLNRSWIGIDVTHLAITLIRHRLHDSFGEDLRPYQLIGDPKDLHSAHSLAQHDRYQFEWWALGLVDARPAQDKRKGADAGIDGYINFFDDNSGQAKRVVVQVKSGNVSVSQIRDLKGVLAREKAAIGLFITLKPPTGPMRKEAAAAGFYQPSHFLDHTFPRVQILTIEELLGGTQAQYPRFAPQATFRQAPRRLREQSIQAQMI